MEGAGVGRRLSTRSLPCACARESAQMPMAPLLSLARTRVARGLPLAGRPAVIANARICACKARGCERRVPV